MKIDMSAVRQFQPLMPFSVPAFAASLFALGLALGTTIAVGMLFFIQVHFFIWVYNVHKLLVLLDIYLCHLGINHSKPTIYYIEIVCLFQIKVILRNKTSIESWIEEKVRMSDWISLSCDEILSFMITFMMGYLFFNFFSFVDTE